MTAPGDTSSEFSPLQKEALAWVIRLHSGEATTEDAEAIAQWRQQSAEHEQAFREAVGLWRRLGETARNYVDQGDTLAERSALAHSRDLLLSRRGLLGGAVAASLATYLVVRPPFDLWPSYQELSADYRTSKGEQRDIELSRNVSLKLNTLTSIAVHGSLDGSQIELISGEAVVTATRDTGRPLVVKAGNGQITATRAQYNARCLDGKVAISCLDGAVVIDTEGKSLTLPKGQQISYSRVGLDGPRVLDVEEATAWESGLLIVHDRPLGDVVKEVNRYRPGRIIVTNSRLGRRMITGTFHLDQLDDFVGQVRSLFGVSVQSLPGGVVLLS